LLFERFLRERNTRDTDAKYHAKQGGQSQSDLAKNSLVPATSAVAWALHENVLEYECADPPMKRTPAANAFMPAYRSGCLCLITAGDVACGSKAERLVLSI
jgi:hypothetical protein